MQDRGIQERVLGEVMIGLKFWTGSTLGEFGEQMIRAAVYDCPTDRRAIVKDIRAIWNPDGDDGNPNESLGSGAEASDDRIMVIKTNRTAIARTYVDNAVGADEVPDAIMEPNFSGGHAASIVLEPGERLEVGMYVNRDNNTGTSEDYVIVRVCGVEVLL